MSSFADLGVPAPLCATLARRGINEPFPIQAATLPDALAGRDVAGKAPTGSGKTLAFGLAIAAAAAAARTPEARRPRALVLVPTRELAAQVQRELTALIDERAHGPVAAIYGGVGYGPQRKLLTRGVSAVVACPGRLEDLIATGDVRLDAVDIVVLDEADRMADMGFMPAVRRLLDRTPDDRQTLLFSATLDGDVDKLVRAYQHDPVHHAVAGADDDDVEVTHHFWTVAREARVGLTADIINRAGSTIVFTRTRHGADRVTRQLARYGVKAVPIHGRRSQAQRDQALKQFSTGRAPALIATDVAARGIHVDAVGCVVHFDLPDDPKDYVHRSGRTGRAGASGTVVALVGDDARKAARTLQRALGRDEPFEPADPSKLPAAEPFVASDVDESDRARTSEHGHSGGRSSGRGARSERPRGDRSRGDRDRRSGNDRRDRPVLAESGRPRRPGRAERNGRDHGDVRVDRNGHDDRGGVVSGTVSSYNPQRGYGFISRRGGGDVFVHVSALPGGEPTLEAGQRVRFELAPGKRGQQARNVRPVG
jgi:superfamily II DNA/RNA helicase